MTERYYHAAGDKSYLQVTTSKEGLVISVTPRALGHVGEWTTITLNAEQRRGLKKFMEEVE